MKKDEVLAKLREVKPSYEKEGFVIKGIFGSVARGDDNENSDIDVLYDLNPEFTKRHFGFYAVGRIEAIKEELREVFGCEVDLASTNNHNKILKEVVAREAVYV